MEAVAAGNPSLLFAGPIKNGPSGAHMRKLKKNMKSMAVRRRPLEKRPLLELDEPRDPDLARSTNANRGLRRLVTSIKSRFKAAPSKKAGDELILAGSQFSELSEASSRSDDVKLRAEYDVKASQCMDSVFGEDVDDYTPLLGDATTDGKGKGLKKRASRIKAAVARKLTRGLQRVL